MDAITDAITQTQRNWVFALRQIYATQRKSPIALRLRCVVITTYSRAICYSFPRRKSASSFSGRT